MYDDGSERLVLTSRSTFYETHGAICNTVLQPAYVWGLNSAFLLAGAIYAEQSTITIDGNTSFDHNSVQGEITPTTYHVTVAMPTMETDQTYDRFCGLGA